MKPILSLAAAGFLGVVLWKVLLLPLLAGVLGFALKIGLLVAAVLVVMWLFRKNKKAGTDGKEGEAGAG